MAGMVAAIVAMTIASIADGLSWLWAWVGDVLSLALEFMTAHES